MNPASQRHGSNNAGRDFNTFKRHRKILKQI